MAAEAGDSIAFNFTDFQRGFTEAWDLIIPNAILILLCVVTANLVGKLEVPWTIVPVDHLKKWLQKLTEFLDAVKIFGSKILPAVAFIVLGLSALDVFATLKDCITDVCPPHISFIKERLYAKLARQEILLHVALKQSSITTRDQLYRYLVEWEDKIKEDKTLPRASNVDFWRRREARWVGYSESVKFLAIVAILSASVGIWVFKKMGIFGYWRLLVVALPILGLAYVYCVAKTLYADEQLAFSCLSALEAQYDSEPANDWSALLQQRLAKLDVNKDDDVLAGGFGQRSEGWWKLEWTQRLFPFELLRLLIEGLFPQASDARDPAFGRLISEGEIGILKHQIRTTPSSEPSPTGTGSTGGKTTQSN